MSALFFSIQISKDPLIGYVFVPFLLSGITADYYQKNKRITDSDSKDLVFPFTDCMLKIIKLANSLSYTTLNKQFNSKHKKVKFTVFYETTDTIKRKFIDEVLEQKRVNLLQLIREHKPITFITKDRVNTIYKKECIFISNKVAQVGFSFEKKAETLHYQLQVFYDTQKLDLKDTSLHILTDKTPAILYQNKMIWFETESFNGNKLKPFQNKDEIIVPTRLEDVFFEKFIKPAVVNFDCTVKGFKINEIFIKPKVILKIEATIFNTFIFTLYFRYKEYQILSFFTQKSFVSVRKVNGIYELDSIQRDFIYEKSKQADLKELGLLQKETYFNLAGQTKDKYEFIEQIRQLVPKLQKKGFVVSNALFSNTVSYTMPQLKYQTQEKQDWFDLYIQVKFGKFKVPFQELKQHILNDIHEFVLPDNSIAIIPKVWFSRLNALAKKTNNSNKTSLHKTHLKVLERSELLKPNAQIRESIDNLKIPKDLDLPKHVKATLRDYQIFGFKYLYHLTQKHFGICLADDMGLGKTLQVITLLQKYYENKQPGNAPSVKNKPTKEISTNVQLSLFDFTTDLEQTKPPIEASDKPFKSSLVVVPKSLLFNWMAELDKFAPELTYAVFHDINRTAILRQVLHKKHLIITTYGVVRQDVTFLKEFQFSYLILDESQAIKNPKSKTFQAVLVLDSQYRITMTGTPFENNLDDLWAQMSFLNHNTLGELSYFEKAYKNPIQQNIEAPELTELRNIISPFILRRLKKDVAKDLPDKIEQSVYCEMHLEQLEWYEKEKSKIRNELLSEYKTKNFITVLAVLNRLRQIAIHPKLVDKESMMTSGKFETILQYIHTILEQGAKFLIFSSYVKHLELFQDYFEKEAISYSMLTGKDQNRQEIVTTYEQTDSIKPFLISIKAGGVGLNLTSANYVFIIDPWWNPFVEQQAIDRVHRIGQDKNVMVYRFIAKDSIEEKIQNLQKSKLNMSDVLIDKNFVKKLKFNDLKQLME